MSSSIFHEPWWLDAVAPNRWQEVTVTNGGRTIARLPFMEQRRLGLRLLLAPPLTGRLGPLVEPHEGKYHRRIGHQYEVTDALIDALPPHDLFRENLRPENANWFGWHRRGALVEPRLSYVIDDLKDLSAVWSNISDKTRNIIRKAEQKLRVDDSADAARLFRLVETTFARQDRSVPYRAAMLRRLVDAVTERDRGVLLTACDRRGTAHASALIVWDDRRAYYLVGGADPAHRSSGATSLLLWVAIKMSATRTERFDFEGSMIPGVERSFRSFGGRQETYFGVTMMSRRMNVLWGLRTAMSSR